jgi:methyl-accepting chemotaxis protein
LDSIEQKWKALSPARDEVMKVGLSGDLTASIALLKSKETPLWRDLKSDLQKAVKVKDKGFGEKNKQFVGWLNMMLYGMGSFLACVTIGMLLLFKIANDRVVKPLASMVSVASDLAHGEGDLTARLNMKRADEIGEAVGFIDSCSGRAPLSRPVPNS